MGLRLKPCVDHFEHLFSNKFIISIDQHLDILLLTKFESSIDNVIGGKHSPRILNIANSIFRELYSFHKFDGLFGVSIIGIII